MAGKCKRCHRPSVKWALCAVHLESKHYSPPRDRGTSKSAYTKQRRERKWELAHDRKWQDLSQQFLIDNPWCVRCMNRPLHVGGPKKVVAVHSDHVLPIRYFPEYCYVMDMVQPLCFRCHLVKTRYEQLGKCYDYRTSKCYTLDIG